MNPLRLVFVEPKGGGKIQDGVTVTPTKEEQTVEPDPGFDGLGAVTVEAIPDAYQDVTGVNAGAEDIRVGKIGIDAQGNLLDGEMLPRKPEQEKSVTPTKQAQTVSPDPGYALSAVNVEKIPDAYQDVSFVDNEAADIRVGKTGVSATGERLDGQMLPRKPEQTKSVTPTKSSQLVAPDSGYALSAVEVDAIPDEYANVSRVTADADKVKAGYVFVNSEGVETRGTNTDDADTSDGTMSASQLEAGAVGYSQGQRIVGTKPIRTTDVEIDSLSPVPIPAGSYDGTVSAKIDDTEAAKIVPENIKKDAVILGQVGTYEGADTLNSLLTATMTKYVNNDYVGDGSEGGAPGMLFSHCYSLEEIEMNSMLEVPREFHNRIIAGSAYPGQQLKKASYRSATKVVTMAFRQCDLLEMVDLNSCVEIFDQAFESAGTSHGMTVNMPNCTTLRLRAFWNSGLTAIDMPNITSIDNTVPFQGCFKLTSVNMPNLVSIGNYYGQGCFQGCSALTLIDLPKVTSISGAEWQGCTNLATIILRADTVCTLGGSDTLKNSPFAANKAGGTLYVPQNLVSQYENATNWSVVIARNPLNQILPIEGSPYEVTT